MKHQILRTNGNSYHLRLEADRNDTFTALGYGTLNQFSLDFGIQIIKFIDLDPTDPMSVLFDRGVYDSLDGVRSIDFTCRKKHGHPPLKKDFVVAFVNIDYFALVFS